MERPVPQHHSLIGQATLALRFLALLAILAPFLASAQPRLVPGEIDGLGDFLPGEWIEMRDDGSAGDGVAGDGVFTARATFAPHASPRSLGYLVVPAGGTIDDAVGLVPSAGGDVLPVPVDIPASVDDFVLEVRFVPSAPQGFGPAPSLADSWNTGFSLDASLRREVPMVIAGSFQDLLGTAAWDASSEVTRLRDDGAFGDREAADGLFSFAFISPVGIDRGSPGSWRVALQTAAPEDAGLGLGIAGWSESAEGNELSVEMDRWMPARFEVDLLRGMTRVTEAPELLDLPMISQMHSHTGPGTYVDVMNTADAVLALAGVYLADDAEYHRLPLSPAAAIAATDFNVAFPAGAWIAPSTARTVTVVGDAAGFETVHGRPPDYLVVTAPTETNHMRLAYPQSVGSSKGLTDSGEYLVLYTWMAGMPLVEDLDALVWGSPSAANLFPNKTGVEIGGATYGEDAGTINTERAAGFSSGGTALWRVDFRRAGVQRLFSCEAPCTIGDGTGYNGAFHTGAGGRYDASNQDLTGAAGRLFRAAVDPGTIASLSLSGTVEDEDGAPLADVTVTARRGTEVHATTTDAGGGFSLDLPHGTWHLTASSFGYSTARSTVRVDHLKTLSEPIVLAQATTLWTIVGVVTAAEDASAIDGAVIVATPGGESAGTNVAGEYQLELLEGAYTLSATAPGFQPSIREVILDRDLVVDFSLAPAALPVRVSGRVERTGDGEPIAEATVLLDDRAGSVLTDSTHSDGSFEFLQVPGEAAYLLTVQASGYQTHQRNVEVLDSDLTDLLIELIPATANLVLSGTVASADTGAPIQGAAVEVELNDGTVRSVATDSTGGYAIDGLAPGSYAVAASAAGFQRKTETISITTDTELDFLLSPAASTRVAISGTVTLDGRPESDWAGSTVTANGPSQRSVLTGAGGAYALNDLSPGSYTLNVTRAGFVTATRAVEVAADLTVDFSLQATPEDDEETGCDCSSTGKGGGLWSMLLLMAGLTLLRRSGQRPALAS